MTLSNRKSSSRSLASQVTNGVSGKDVFLASFLSRENMPFAVCANLALFKAMKADLPVYTISKGWIVKGISESFIHDELEDLGGHVVSVCRSSGGSWEMCAAWDDAVAHVEAHALCKSSRRRRERRQSSDTRAMNPERKIYSIRLEFVSSCEFDSRVELISRVFRPYVVSTTEQTRRKVFVLANTESGLGLQPIGSIEETLIRDNYASSVLDAFDHVVCDIMSEDPCGRLVLVHGPTGTGKTYLVRGIVEAVKGVRFVLVPGTLVSQLTSPGLASLLARQKITTCLIIEDADMLLIKRTGDNMSSISTMLNLADGIFGALSDVRIVCTTNATKLEFDKAILREGRLCRNIEIPVLKQEHAQAIYRRLVNKDAYQSEGRSLAQVYRDARNAGWKPDQKTSSDDVVVKAAKSPGKKRSATP